MGLFAANSGINATTSAEGNDDEHIEEKGKLFLRPVLLRSFFVPLVLLYSLRLAARVIRACRSFPRFLRALSAFSLLHSYFY